MLKRIVYIWVAFFFLISLADAATLDHLLLVAAQQGNMQEVRSLLKRGANPNAANDDGNTFTALMLAAREGHTDVIRLLLESGAKVDTTGAITVGVSGVADSITALMNAAASGDTSTVEILLNHKADPNVIQIDKVQDDSGNGTMRIVKSTPLVMYADNAAVLRILIEHGANPNTRDSDGNTLLMRVAEYRNADAVKYLLSKGLDPLEKNKAGLTALDLARKAGKQENVQLLEKVINKKCD